MNIEKEISLMVDLYNICKSNDVKCFLGRPLPLCKIPKVLQEDEFYMDIYNETQICSYGPLMINPDLTLFPCPSIVDNNFIEKKLTSFRTIDDLYMSYSLKIEELSRKNIDENCIDCNDNIKNLCHGGCLANKIDVNF